MNYYSKSTVFENKSIGNSSKTDKLKEDMKSSYLLHYILHYTGINN